MKAWTAKLLAPTAVGAAIGGVATFFGAEAVNYYYYERNEVAGQAKEALAAIDPFLHPLPKTLRESEGRITGLRGKPLLFQSDEAKAMFALAIGHPDEYLEGLRAREVAEAEQKRQRANVIAAKRLRNEAGAKRAQRTATEQAKKVAAANKVVAAASKTISNLAKFSSKFRLGKR